MTVFRAQCAFQLDGPEASDLMMINPVFNAQLSPDANALADDLADGLLAWQVLGPTTPVRVKMYDVQGSKPVYPAGEAYKNWDQPPKNTSSPRELAVCLSFYGDYNRPRTRGRLYIPVGLASTSSTHDRQVPAALRTKVADLVSLFTNLGGLDVDWSVWSTIDKQAHAVKNWWVDDDWDIIRSRGRKASTRDQGTTGE